jgi:hypothetical protein
MKRHQDRSAINRPASLVASAAVVLLILSTPILAQRDSGRGPSPQTDRAREQGVLEHERQLRVMLNSTEAAQPGDQSHLRAIIQQIKQDFERIQVVNTELVRNVSAENTGFNYKNITELTSEIRKRARRFKENISLPPPDESLPNAKKLDQLNQDEMRGALLMLSERIISFVANPLFQTSNLMDIKLGAKASNDLAVIIELSGTIKKNAERLAKSQK